VQEKEKALDQGKTSGGIATLSRLVWMFIGPLSLGIIAYRTVTQRDGWFTFRDAVCVVTLALMIIARWLEIRSGPTETATGEPATMEHFKRYVKVLLPVTIAAWCIVKVIGNHMLS